MIRAFILKRGGYNLGLKQAAVCLSVALNALSEASHTAHFEQYIMLLKSLLVHAYSDLVGINLRIYYD